MALAIIFDGGTLLRGAGGAPVSIVVGFTRKIKDRAIVLYGVLLCRVRRSPLLVRRVESIPGAEILQTRGKGVYR